MLDSRTIAAISMLCAALLAGCLGERVAGGTGVGNPTKGSVTVALQAASGQDALAKPGATQPRNPDGTFSVTDAGGTVFTIRSALANVGRVRLQLPEGIVCKDADETECESGEVSIPGPFVADLMTGGWQPDPGVVRIPVGEYRRMDVRLEAMEKGATGTDPDLPGHSMVVKGSFDYAGKADRSFSLALDFDEDARFENLAGLGVEAEGLNRLIVLLDVEQWLAKANITGCLDDKSLSLDAQGGLHVDKENACPGLENILKDAIKGSGNLRGRHE
ncbi:MAG: hypothetical protein JWO30_4265 [Fibrobacteres bacterium]|nr:hypothetical protein [Fibrobacterota bacterium]